MKKNQTAQEKQEKELELVREVLSYDVSKRDMDCNERLLLDACAGQEMNLDTVCAAYGRVKHKFADSPVWAEAVRELQSAHPEFSLNLATLQLLVDAWGGSDLRDFEVSGDGLIKLAETLNAKSPLPLTPEYLQQQAEIAERSRLIEEISQGRDVYEYRRPEDGAVVVYQVHGPEGLDPEPLERLREIAGLMAEQRKYLKMDSKQWLEEERQRGIRKMQEQAGMTGTKTLPATWNPSEDGPRFSVGLNVRKNVPVALTPESFRRMSLADIKEITIRYGGSLVNEKLVGTKLPRWVGNVQVIQG